MLVQSIPYPTSTGPVGDFVVGVQSIASGTSNATVGGTSTNMTGKTPIAALVVHSRHAIANDPTETPHAEWSLGFLQSTNDYLLANRAEDNSATTDTDTAVNDNLVARTSLATSVTLGRSATGTLASGGLNLTWSGTDLVSRRLSYMAFGGADAQAYSVNRQYSGVALTQTTTFEPDVVFLMSGHQASASITASISAYSFGVALKDGTQMCVIGIEADAAAAGSPLQAILTNRAGGRIGTAAGLTYDMTVGGFSGTGYTVTPSVAPASHYYQHLALDLGGRRSKLLAFTTPTTTGDSSITGVGFTPQAALVVLTNLQATDPTFPIATSDLMSGLSISLIADNAASHSVRSDSGAAPTDTASQSRTIALIGASATDCDAITATLVSFDSDGMTLNYSAVQPNGKKGFILFIE